MPQKQKIAILGRQAEDLGLRLTDWLRRHQALAIEEERGISDEIDAYLGEVRDLTAATQPGNGAIGVLSIRGASTQPVVDVLIEQLLRYTEAPRGLSSVDIVRTLRSQPGDARGAVVVRYRTGGSGRHPQGYPVQLVPLNELEIAEILAQIFLDEFPSSRRRVLPPETVLALMADVRNRMQPHSGVGLAPQDVVRLSEGLLARFPEAPLVRQLSGVGYWDELAALIEHVGHDMLPTLLAPLWGGEPTITSLFKRLAEVLHKIGGATAIYCPVEAVAASAGAGWATVHAASVLSRSTILGLASADGPSVRTVDTRGHAREIERAALAAITAELVLDLPTAEARSALDVLDLPQGVSLREFPHELFQPRASTMATVLSLYAQRKADYLVARAVRRWHVTALVVATATAAEPDPSRADLIAGWIETTQGESAHHRARRRNGFYVLASGPPGARLGSYAAMPDHALDHRRQLLADVFADRPDCLTEWTPGHPFANLFFDRSQDGEPAASGPIGTLSQRGMQPEFVRALGELLVPDALSAMKAQQIGLGIARKRWAMRSRLARHQTSSHFDQGEWRRQASNIVLNHVRACASQGRIGDLQRLLTPTEGELRAVSVRLGLFGATPASQSDWNSRLQTFSALVVGYWLRMLRAQSRSPRLARWFSLPGTTFPHLVDEISLAVTRVGLSAHLASKLGELGGASQIDRPDVARLDCASIAARLIGQFIEKLDLTTPAVPASAGAGSGGMAEVTQLYPASSPGMARRGPALTMPQADAGATLAAVRWCDALAAMLEANLVGPAGRSVASGNRELGELLSELSRDQFGIEM